MERIIKFPEQNNHLIRNASIFLAVCFGAGFTIGMIKNYVDGRYFVSSKLPANPEAGFVPASYPTRIPGPQFATPSAEVVQQSEILSHRGDARIPVKSTPSR